MLKKRLPPPTTAKGGEGDGGLDWTFKRAAQRYIEAARQDWRSPKHAAQWEATLNTYVYPVIGHLHPEQVDVDLVHEIVKPIWGVKAETANRVRGRIEMILDREIAFKRRQPGNPATKKIVQHLTGVRHVSVKGREVSERANVQDRRGGMPSPTRDALGQFIVDVWATPSVTGYAVLYLAHTVARENMGLGAAWSEVDLETKLWSIPGERMKGGEGFIQPLSTGAIQVLLALGPPEARKGLIFKSPTNRTKPLSDATCDMLIRRWCKKRASPHWVPHGLRSSFRNWARTTDRDHHLSEMCLAHSVDTKTEAAYLNEDPLVLRAAILEHWSKELAGRQALAD